MKSAHHSYRNDEFYVENTSISRLVKDVGTPVYVYSKAEITECYRSYAHAFRKVPHHICFSLKSCPNLAIGRLMARLGGGVDVVSGGELERALRAGFPLEKIIFSGVGKTKEELKMAIKKGIRLINVESAEELQAVNEVACAFRKVAPISLRVNPNVRAGGHPHISTGTPANKFGVHYKQIIPLYLWASRQRYLRPIGIQCHIGSQITRVGPYKRAITVLLDLVMQLQKEGISIDNIDVGGGLGVDYHDDHPDSPTHLASVILPHLKGKPNITLLLEPGRSLLAQAGILVTRVLYRKDAGRKHFVIVDAAMNDLARPALYDAYHDIVPVRRRKGEKINVDVVGPICESGDYFAQGRSMVLPSQNDLLAVLTAGAYGFSMSSQYNSRPRVPEVLVSKHHYAIIRRRETFDDLIRHEIIPRGVI